MTLFKPSHLPDLTKRAMAPSPYAWFVVALLWLVAMLNYVDRLMITTMRDPIRADISITDAQFGLLTSVFLWVYALVSPFGGYVADRFTRRGVITASLLFWSAATFLTGLAHTFHQLLWARALMGVSEACYLPAALALICDYHPGPTRSFATGVHMSGLSVGAALGGIGGYLAERIGWRAGFERLGIAGLAYGLLVLMTLRDADSKFDLPASATGDVEDKSGAAMMLTWLLAKRGFQILFVVNILVGMSNWTLYGWLPTYLKEHFRLGLGAAGLSATGYVQAAAFVGVFAGGFIADRWIRTNRHARSLTPGVFYMVAGPCLFAAASTHALPLAIMGLIVFGLARGAFDANHMPVLREITRDRYSATGFGIVNMVSCAAGGAMVYVGGALSDAHVSLARIFQLCGVALSIVGLLLIAISRSGSTKISDPVRR
ncbi:MAG TPA: MFS transporter [Tepidisphaeraceae bacterium]|nr:MFS transporter [Tepidisphaeraceae bacterium]